MIKDIFIFDFDGVILDDTAKIFDDHIEIAKQMNLPPPDHALLKKYSGKPWEAEMIPGIAKKLGWTESQRKEFIIAFTNHHLKNTATPIPDVACLFETLRLEGHLLSIISSRDKTTLGIKLKELGIDSELFYLIQSREDCLHKKPSGKVFYPLFQKLACENIELARVIYIGDSIIADHKAILNLQKATHKRRKPIKRYLVHNNVSVHFIGVTTLHTDDEFSQAGVLHVIPSLRDLSKVLQKIK